MNDMHFHLIVDFEKTDLCVLFKNLDFFSKQNQSLSTLLAYKNSK